MTKSKFVLDKLTKLLEQGLISYKDLSAEFLNILNSKRDEFVFKMNILFSEASVNWKHVLGVVEFCFM